MNRLLIAFIALGIACGASSCNLWRKVTGRRKAAPVADSSNTAVKRDSAFTPTDTLLVRRDTAIIPPPAIDSQKQALIQKWLPLWNAQTAYTTFSGKAKVDYHGMSESQDFVATIRMEKDKRIWIAITGSFLGLTMEAARVFITPDSIIAIDRIHKEVRMLPFSEAGKLIPMQVDFSTLQSLIIGDVLHTGGGAPMDIKDTAGTFILQFIDATFANQAQYQKSDTTLQCQILETPTTVLSAQYANYGNMSERRFSGNRIIIIKDKGDFHQLTLDFTKATFDEPVDMSFSIPSKYERK